MAKIVVLSGVEFRRALERVARPQTHFVVTDWASSIMAVPKVASRHRHYIYYTTMNSDEIRELAEYAKSKGFDVIQGYAQLIPEA